MIIQAYDGIREDNGDERVEEEGVRAEMGMLVATLAGFNDNFGVSPLNTKTMIGNSNIYLTYLDLSNVRLNQVAASVANAVQ